MAVAFNIKDFVSNSAQKVRGIAGLGAGTDESLPAHMVQDSAGNEILGTMTTARSTSTDTTSTSFMAVWKQISFSVQALVTALPAFTRGAGAVDSGTQRVVSASDDPAIALTGALTETAPASDTASSGLNGRLQRIAQRISSLITLHGNATDAASTATNSTSVSFMQVFKQISASVQALVTALPAFTRGAGAADSSTMRITVASADQTAQVADNADGVAASGSLLNIPVVAKLMAWSGTAYDRVQLDNTTKGVKTQPQAGELHLGEVGGNTILFDVTPTLDTSAYATDDVLFDRTVLTNFFRKNDGTGILQSIQVIDGDDQGVAIDFYLHTTNQPLGTANAAPSISDANAAALIGPFSIAAADYKDLGGVKVGKIAGLAQAIKSVSGARTIYISAVVKSGTPTFTASGMVLRIGALLD